MDNNTISVLIKTDPYLNNLLFYRKILFFFCIILGLASIGTIIYAIFFPIFWVVPALLFSGFVLSALFYRVWPTISALRTKEFLDFLGKKNSILGIFINDKSISRLKKFSLFYKQNSDFIAIAVISSRKDEKLKTITYGKLLSNKELAFRKNYRVFINDLAHLIQFSRNDNLDSNISSEHNNERLSDIAKNTDIPKEQRAWNWNAVILKILLVVLDDNKEEKLDMVDIINPFIPERILAEQKNDLLQTALLQTKTYIEKLNDFTETQKSIRANFIQWLTIENLNSSLSLQKNKMGKEFKCILSVVLTQLNTDLSFDQTLSKENKKNLANHHKKICTQHSENIILSFPIWAEADTDNKSNSYRSNL